MFIQLFISGVMLGFVLGLLLCSRVMQGWQDREVRRRDMDQLLAQFHALFQQIDQEKRPRP